MTAVFQPPDPGALRRRVTFEQRTPGRDSAGGPLDTWQPVFTSYAKVEPLSGRELLAAQVVHAEITLEVWVRYRPEFADPKTATALRIRYGARLLNILSVIDVDDLRQWVVCQCSEGIVEA